MNLEQYNFTPKEEAALVVRELKKAHDVFVRDALDDDEPVMCRLHDVFGTFNTADHNCLGCNFANSIDLIEQFLKTYSCQERIQIAYTTYIMMLYLLVERVDVLFNLIKLNDEYRKENFKVFMLIRRWANFIKHPKAFILTHHPEYTYHGSVKSKDLSDNASVVINRAFIDKYYSNDDKNEELFKKLENKEDILVVYPDIVETTEKLCKAMHDCISVIADNAVYHYVLKSRTTFLDFWSDVATEENID